MMAVLGCSFVPSGLFLTADFAVNTHKTEGSCIYSSSPIHAAITTYTCASERVDVFHRGNTNAELHIFSSAPSSLFHTVPFVRLIQSSGLTLAWLSNIQAYCSSGQHGPPQRPTACEHILTEPSKSPCVNCADTVSEGEKIFIAFFCSASLISCNILATTQYQLRLN